MKIWNTIALILTIIGAVNWGLIGLFDFNLVSLLFGDGMIARVIYVAVGIAGISLVTLFPKIQQDY